MPQLDKITFFSQFFWLSFFYLGFYFLVYKYFLPQMSRALKFRKRRMNNSQQGVTSMGQESDKVGSSYQALLSTGLTTCKSVFNQNFKGAEDWVNSTVSQANQTRLKNTNRAYISSLGERSVSQRLVISQTSAGVSEKTYFFLLINKLLFLKKATQQTQQSVQGSKPKLAEKAHISADKKDTADIRLGKNKTKQNKEEEQIVASPNAKAKVSANKGSKNKTGKKQ